MEHEIGYMWMICPSSLWMEDEVSPLELFGLQAGKKFPKESWGAGLWRENRGWLGESSIFHVSDSPLPSSGV